MRVIRTGLLCLALGAFSLPATAQQSLNTPDKPAATGFKAKLKDKRAKLAARMKMIYFAAGCKILDNEARAGLVDAEAARIFVRQKADPQVDDLKKEVGDVRVEPSRIGWKPAGETQWHYLTLKDFSNLASHQGTKGDAG